jgi:hypothetical protein
MPRESNSQREQREFLEFIRRQQKQQEFEAQFSERFAANLDRYHQDPEFKHRVWMLHEVAALARLLWPEVFGQTRVESHVDTDIPTMIAVMTALEMDLLSDRDNI